ncbi:inositol monophosphatase [Saccharomonospora sp. CUA-673]|nr:inositol monophosphatase family protein [Saccharomonospora sp. CUA-673]OLT43207.1 inositol monophosphatase [Saccharomonospora sp. CUA-673]
MLEVAEKVAVEAAEFVAAERTKMLDGTAVDVQSKSHRTDVVTAVDVASEQLVRDRLAQLRPGDAVLGEEAGGEAGTGADAVTWVVDPIDGTVNFLYGAPHFAVSLAAQIDGESVAGVVVEPVSRRRWTAVRGGGAWLDGRRLAVSEPSGLDMTLLGTGFAYLPERRRRQAAMVSGLAGHVRDIRCAGAASLDLCHVGAGWTDAFVEHGLSRWDWAAGALVAREAGAVVSVPGEDPELGEDGTFAAAPSIADELRAMVLELGVRDI